MLERSVHSELSTLLDLTLTAGLIQHFQNDDRSPFYEFFIFLGDVLCNHIQGVHEIIVAKT